MFQSIKNSIRNNSGDMYIQMLICLMAVVVIISFSFNVITVMSQKMWIDDKLNDITRVIAVTGSVKDENVVKIVDEIEEKMGGEVSFSSNDWFDESEGKVQLKGVVEVNYYNEEFPAITLVNYDITIEVDLTKQGISEVYFKPST